MRSSAPLSRRRLLEAGGMVEIRMAGRPDGSHVWFDPIGLRVRPGQPMRWVNADPGNAHTSTAYHPDNGGRPRRVPRAAEPWDSGYLLPGESFEVRLTAEGVYDYVCMPHEQAGMVGRLVVLAPGSSLDGEAELRRMEDSGLPAAATLPSVADILAQGRVGPSRRAFGDGNQPALDRRRPTDSACAATRRRLYVARVRAPLAASPGAAMSDFQRAAPRWLAGSPNSWISLQIALVFRELPPRAATGGPSCPWRDNPMDRNDQRIIDVLFARLAERQAPPRDPQADAGMV